MVTQLLDHVGCTPLVELTSLQPKEGVRIFAKLEGQNPSGSVKDRVALGLIRAAEAEGRIKPGDTLVEASSGNTGIALAMVGKRLGYEVNVVLPKSVAPSITDVLELYGIETIFCDQCRDMKTAIDLAERLAGKNGWHPLRQFWSRANRDVHYATTGAELLEQLPQIDVFIAGIGTGGTVMGVGDRLREANPQVRIVGVEPKLGDKLQGLRSIQDGFRPPLLDLSKLDGRRMVDNPSAIRAVEDVVRSEGINAGVSSGATLHAALKEAERMESGNIVVMFSDGGWKYLPARPWKAAQDDDEHLDDVHWW
jgi:[CysO sulfur-carrier protein]-thiocarboxylate-dependent cysteine synthase